MAAFFLIFRILAFIILIYTIPSVIQFYSNIFPLKPTQNKNLNM